MRFEFLKFNLDKGVVAGRKRANELKTMGVTETEWKRMKEIIDRERRKSRDLTLTGGTRSPREPSSLVLLFRSVAFNVDTRHHGKGHERDIGEP